MQSLTLAGKLALSNNRPAGFDYMRIVLAAAVVLQHTVNVGYGQAAAVAFWDTPARMLVGPILPMFFALSGFLVAGSLFRCATLISFFGLRALRIVPALAVEVCLSALILGPLFTDLPLADYYGAGEFRAYFLNILGEIHYRLPGVFAHNPVPLVVNGQLWTVPWELKCYAALGVLALVGLTWRRHALLLTLGLGQAALAAYAFLGSPEPSVTVPGLVLVYAFLCGLLLYVYRDRAPWSPALFLAAATATALLLMVDKGDYLVGLPVAYATVFLGLCAPKRHRLLLSGDYSYGIFLYGYPIQQAIAALGPVGRVWYVNFGLTMPIAAAVAVASWWLVEKPALARKSWLLASETAVLRWLPRRLHLLLTGLRLRPPVAQPV